MIKSSNKFRHFIYWLTLSIADPRLKWPDFGADSPLCYATLRYSRKMILGSMIIFLPIILPGRTIAQDYSRTINKTAEFANPSGADNEFRIMNINGSVAIEVYDGKTIELAVRETITGTSKEIEQAREELKYKLERHNNLILAYLDAPFISVRVRGDDVSYSINRGDDDYEFNHDVQVMVPSGILLNGSTVNNGTLEISGDFKEVKANNVNGDLNLKQLTSKTEATTVNGDIDISYERQPAEDCSYRTINGTIDIEMPADLSADVYFKSLHGDIYTNYDVKKLQPEVKEKADSHTSAVRYRVDKFSPVRIGDGGPKLSFDVLNGDAYLRKKESH